MVKIFPVICRRRSFCSSLGNVQGEKEKKKPFPSTRPPLICLRFKTPSSPVPYIPYPYLISYRRRPVQRRISVFICASNPISLPQPGTGNQSTFPLHYGLDRKPERFGVRGIGLDLHRHADFKVERGLCPYSDTQVAVGNFRMRSKGIP